MYMLPIHSMNHNETMSVTSLWSHTSRLIHHRLANRMRRSEPSLCQWCCRPTQLFRKFAFTRQVNRYGIQCSGHLDFGVPLQQFLSELQTCRTDVRASVNVGLCKIRHPATSSNSIVEWNCRLPKQPPTSNKNCNPTYTEDDWFTQLFTNTPTASSTRTPWVSCTFVYSKPNFYCLLLFNFPRLYWPLFIQHPNHSQPSKPWQWTFGGVIKIGTVPEPTSLSTVGLSKSRVKPGHPHLFHVNQSSCTLQPRHPRHDGQRLLARDALGADEHLLIRSTQLQFLEDQEGNVFSRSSMDGFTVEETPGNSLYMPTFLGILCKFLLELILGGWEWKGTVCEYIDRIGLDFYRRGLYR